MGWWHDGCWGSKDDVTGCWHDGCYSSVGGNDGATDCWYAGSSNDARAGLMAVTTTILWAAGAVAIADIVCCGR